MGHTTSTHAIPAKKKFVFLATMLLLIAITQCRPDVDPEKEVNPPLPPPEARLNPSQALGKKLFFDTNLSNPPGQSCATCHMPEKGFADPEHQAVSQGANKAAFGTRNAPTVAYAAYTPYFHFDSAEQVYIGGLFWDGRSNTLSEQAMSPLLTHHEMNNTNKKMVVEHVENSEYKDLFLYVFGASALADTNAAFAHITEALEEYEETAEVSPFTSKFDYYLKGLVKLSEAEMRGLEMFNDSLKGNCAACHPSTIDPLTNAVLFTDFTYDNLGVPANPDLISLMDTYQPDLGLGHVVNSASENGKFKVPTLRNIALTAPYFHNGVFKTLDEVMQFYNTRDSGEFGPPEVDENVNKEELGDLGLTAQEMKDIITFMHALTDGYAISDSLK